MLICGAVVAGHPDAVRAQTAAHNPPKAVPDTYAYQWRENPFAGNGAMQEEGERLYKNTCYVCHLLDGGRGPNLKKSKLVDTGFLRVVREGRKGTQMPAWGRKLTEEEMWKIYAWIDAARRARE